MSFRQYMVSLMKDEYGGVPHVMVKGVLRLLSWIYSAAVKVVDLAYRSGLRREHRISVPVVSVGNITLGGTGKTPFTVSLADHFLAEGKKPAVLIRGYGNDENRMLRDELPDIPVYAGQDRVRNAFKAVNNGSDILILDDGFQHRRIARDLNILMLDGACFFGNGSLLPRGLLREPLSAMKRADMFALTKTDMIDDERRRDMVKALDRAVPGKPVVFTRHSPTFLSDATGAAYETGLLSGKKICLVSGIADPDYFAFLVRNLGAKIVARREYGDHYRYRQADIESVLAECNGKDVEAIVVTRKDYVKIKDLDISRIEERLFVLNIVIEVLEGKEQLIAGLNSVVSGQGDQSFFTRDAHSV
ncbi:MAG: tetraacyldisaccharide 4'-kinase [Candidatus Omnitrophota bacterium]|nr:tetraacyldisaccharide 4'-kinase [Candidatus Omnitrophota bacterium]